MNEDTQSQIAALVDRTSEYLERDLGVEGIWPASAKARYGGVIFNSRGEVLLREPTNHYDGYVWTFPKGAPENPASLRRRSAPREVFRGRPGSTPDRRASGSRILRDLDQLGGPLLPDGRPHGDCRRARRSGEQRDGRPLLGWPGRGEVAHIEDGQLGRTEARLLPSWRRRSMDRGNAAPASDDVCRPPFP